MDLCFDVMAEFSSMLPATLGNTHLTRASEMVVAIKLWRYADFDIFIFNICFFSTCKDNTRICNFKRIKKKINSFYNKIIRVILLLIEIFDALFCVSQLKL